MSSVEKAFETQLKVKVTDVKEVDKELIDWVRQAYESAG